MLVDIPDVYKDVLSYWVLINCKVVKNDQWDFNSFVYFLHVGKLTKGSSLKSKRPNSSY